LKRGVGCDNVMGYSDQKKKDKTFKSPSIPYEKISWLKMPDSLDSKMDSPKGKIQSRNTTGTNIEEKGWTHVPRE